MHDARPPRRVAVLGGAGGIGRTLVTRLTAQGDEVVVLDLAASLERHSLDAWGIAIDVCDEQSVISAFAELGRHWDSVDGFVNLAGYNSALQSLGDTSADYFDEVTGGNLRGAFLAAKAVLPLMADGGSAVMISSGLASHVRPGYGAYSVSKAGVIAMTKVFALEAAPRVRFNAVAPGLVDTAFLRGGTGRSEEDRDSIVNLEAYRTATPMQRPGATRRRCRTDRIPAVTRKRMLKRQQMRWSLHGANMLMQVRIADANCELRDRLRARNRQPEANVPPLFKPKPPLLQVA